MKKTILTICFCSFLGFAGQSQAALMTFSYPSNQITFYPSLGWYWYLNRYTPQPYHLKKHPLGSYASWKRNNFHYTQVSEQKMSAYNQLHAQGQIINPLNDPQFLNDIKIYSLPEEAKITKTPKTTEITTPAQIEISNTPQTH